MNTPLSAGRNLVWRPKGMGASVPYQAVTILPVLIVVGLFTLFPFAYAAVTSTRRVLLTMPGHMPFVGLRNYVQVLHDSTTQVAIKNTLLFTSLTVPSVVLVGFLAALLLNQQIRWFGILRALVLLPWSIPLVSAGIIWRLLLHGDFGALDGLLYQLGAIHGYIPWLSTPRLAMYAVAVAHVWREFPLPAILILAGLQVIPGNVVEAARVEGANAWARLLHIVLPWLRGPLLIILVYETMISVSVFDLVYVLTGGGPGSATTLFSWYTYAATFTFLNLGHGAALSFIMATVLLAFIVIYLRIIRAEAHQI
jgi:multiple sugar transport system permease protein